MGNNPLDALLQKEVDRKEFLATVGFGLASLAGLTSLFEAYHKIKRDMSVPSAGYTSNTYGSR